MDECFEQFHRNMRLCIQQATTEHALGLAICHLRTRRMAFQKYEALILRPIM